jgi:hypothetical protein
MVVLAALLLATGTDRNMPKTGVLVLNVRRRRRANHPEHAPWQCKTIAALSC